MRSTDAGKKGNITPEVARDIQIRFSSIHAADMCTMAQTASVLGRDPAPYIETGKISATSSAPASDTMDTCLLPKHVLPPSDPVMLDFEVQDGRSADATFAFLSQWADLVHATGRKAILYPNPLDGPSQKYTNLPAVASKVGSLFDLVHILLWGKSPPGDVSKSFEMQNTLFDVPASKIIITFELAGTSQADASTVRQLLVSGKAAGVNFWRNGATQGGACDTDVNKKIACIAYGRC